MNFKVIKRILDKSLREAEDAALLEGIDTATPSFEQTLLSIKRELLSRMGLSAFEFDEQLNTLKEESQKKKLRKEEILNERLTSLQQDIESKIPTIPEVTYSSLPDKPDIPSEERIKEIAKQVTSEALQAIPRVAPIIQINRPKTEQITQRVEYDATPLMKELGILNDKIESIQIPSYDFEGFKVDLRNQLGNEFQQNLKQSIDILGMPDFRKLAMGLRHDIDELRSRPSGGIIALTNSDSPNTIIITGTSTVNLSVPGAIVHPFDISNAMPFDQIPPSMVSDARNVTMLGSGNLTNITDFASNVTAVGSDIFSSATTGMQNATGIGSQLANNMTLVVDVTLIGTNLATSGTGSITSSFLAGDLIAPNVNNIQGRFLLGNAILGSATSDQSTKSDMFIGLNIVSSPHDYTGHFNTIIAILGNVSPANDPSFTGTVAIGRDVIHSLESGDANLFFGNNSAENAITANGAIVAGPSAFLQATSIADSLAFGSLAGDIGITIVNSMAFGSNSQFSTATPTGEMVVGAVGNPINTIFWGAGGDGGLNNSIPQASVTHTITPGTGTDVIGTDGIYTSGAGTGAGNGSSFKIKTPTRTTSGTTVQTLDTRVTFNSSGMSLNQKIFSYNGINTVSNGVASELATVDLTAQTAAITATTLYAVPASGIGRYRVSWIAKVTTAASTSSVLGGANGFQVKYTDADDSVVVTTGALANENTLALTTNTIQTIYAGSIMVNCKASTNLQYLFDYTSVGTTAMQFNLHIIVEAM